ncbi:glycosyltransferase family 4 protein [Anaeromyxobacter diazotrophicus]|uniref:Glycosyl transferase family 1 n=1 Tax=Anaeromyxobacter diazotrophicus TaxID=2590199 RepID=A0A7I9VK35_9BACT|nr:glycosyltransferase family 1 protein [Anaeromyxobacter diazotrophicus]GEJ56367.1 glycosyl transferase family 1 [Anaeromyxobacter diazotrophicus]
MRIGIDATLVRPDRLTGIERYALSLTTALARQAPGELVLFTRPDAPEALRALPVEQHRSPFRQRVPTEQAWLPLAAARARVDLLHTLAFPTPPLWRGQALLTVHDATPWLHPDTCSAGMRYYYGPLFRQALGRAAGILTVSEASRDDLVRTLGVPRERVHVTHNGVDPRFFDARAPEGPRSPYLLAVGTLEPRKNVPVLLDALRLLRAEGRDLQLVIVGRQGWADALPCRELAAHVRLTGPVPDRELAELYAGATCFVLPSLYEGFGLPLAEAMAAGAPAVVSDIPALHELGGDAALYAPPDAPRAFADAIAQVLDRRDETAARVLRGRERARGCSWDACAEATLAVYRTLTAARPRCCAG